MEHLRRRDVSAQAMRQADDELLGSDLSDGTPDLSTHRQRLQERPRTMRTLQPRRASADLTLARINPAYLERQQRDELWELAVQLTGIEQVRFRSLSRHSNTRRFCCALSPVSGVACKVLTP